MGRWEGEAAGEAVSMLLSSCLGGIAVSLFVRTYHAPRAGPLMLSLIYAVYASLSTHQSSVKPHPPPKDKFLFFCCPKTCSHVILLLSLHNPHRPSLTPSLGHNFMVVAVPCQH